MNDAQMLERVAAEVRGFVERRFAPLVAEVTRLRDALEQQAEAHACEVQALQRALAAVELKQGPAGKDGAAGVDGKDGVNGKDGAAGRDGVDGKDGVNGKDGAAGRDGVDGKDGVGIASIELAPDLRHFDIVLDDERRFEVQLPEGVKGDAGKDGIDGRDGKDGRDGLHGKDGRDGVDGKDGAPGRNGADGANGERGLRGESGADGIDGKDGVDGVSGKDGTQLDDFNAVIKDGRTLAITFTLSDGLSVTKELPLSGMVVDRGIFRVGAKHAHGDAVTYAGSYWIAQRDTESTPGKSDDWRLAVKKGRDGRDGGEE